MIRYALGEHPHWLLIETRLFGQQIENVPTVYKVNPVSHPHAKVNCWAELLKAIVGVV